MRNPVNQDNLCPFINSTCIKRSQKIAGPYPVCSIYKGGKGGVLGDLVCVCPKRFFQAELIDDVIKHCWPEKKKEDLHIAYEVKMKGFGQVDFVLADLDTKRRIKDFLSVELQAIDITGSCETAYSAVVNSRVLDKKPSYGFNYANVRKRYISQLIAKGFFHHHWKTRIIAVIQDHLYTQFRTFLNFDELPVASSNIVFMLYRFATDRNGNHQLVFDRAVGTSHNSLMMGTLYRNPPSRDEFCERILKQIRD